MTSVVSRTYLMEMFIFSDESRFMLFRADGCSRIYQCHYERFASSCVLVLDHFSGGSVMVWAGIHHGGSTALLRVNGALILG